EEWNEIRAAGQARDIEHTGALEEEGPLLWKEQRKTRQIDLTDVRLGLGEVRVHGDRGVQVRRQVLENVETAGELSAACVPPTGYVRPHVEPMPLPCPFQSGELAGVGQIPNPARRARSRPS